MRRLLLFFPTTLAFITGSPSGAIAISFPIIAGTMNFTANNASLLYIAAFLGYLAAPTHLCLALTADYFKSSLNKVYRYLGPSIAASFSIAILVYYLF